MFAYLFTTVSGFFVLRIFILKITGNFSPGVAVNVPEWDLVVIEFKCQSRYYVHFQTHILGQGMNLLIPLVMGLIVPLLLFYKDGFEFKQPIKVDIPLKHRNQTNKEMIQLLDQVCHCFLSLLKRSEF